ncbi:MAG TPA: Flp family type IVb pilin [Intrasporangium sp.]|uniref:Flp family type IVb pilin n=1 Tax=Intrasporangium sp. TaxID=1925024 RepID=UPI002D7817F1|nr:Flp family type IVb pilin [Intrasporangium sp.]HET7398029.1 Flp family type IVb pilin [Intrasporangium sp.]
MTKLAAKVQTRINVVKDRMTDDKGATAVEYGLMVALIAAIIVVVVKALGTKVNAAFNTVNSNMP